MNLRPHDLLHIDIASIVSIPGCPAWVYSALGQTPWVVVRRAFTDESERLPVGIRGTSRDQRFATTIPEAAVQQILRPEDLVSRIQSGQAPNDLAALAVLPALAEYLHQAVWGPTGSVGFHLATGTTTVTSISDLDLILRYAQLQPRNDMAKIFQGIKTLAPTADILIELPGGALSLQEYVTTDGPLALRTSRGPAWMDPTMLSALAQKTAA